MVFVFWSRQCAVATGLRTQHPSTMQIYATVGVHAGINTVASVRRSGFPLGRDTGMPVLLGRMLALLALLPGTWGLRGKEE